jgi:hypothetical protein
MEAMMSDLNAHQSQVFAAAALLGRSNLGCFPFYRDDVEKFSRKAYRTLEEAVFDVFRGEYDPDVDPQMFVEEAHGCIDYVQKPADLVKAVKLHGCLKGFDLEGLQQEQDDRDRDEAFNDACTEAEQEDGLFLD